MTSNRRLLIATPLFVIGLLLLCLSPSSTAPPSDATVTPAVSLMSTEATTTLEPLATTGASSAHPLSGAEITRVREHAYDAFRLLEPVLRCLQQLRFFTGC